MMLLMSEEQFYESASAPSVIVSGLFAILMSQQNAANLIGWANELIPYLFLPDTEFSSYRRTQTNSREFRFFLELNC